MQKSDVICECSLLQQAQNHQNTKAAQPTEMDFDKQFTNFHSQYKVPPWFHEFFFCDSTTRLAAKRTSKQFAREKKIRLGFTSFSRLNHSAHLTTETEVKAKRNSFRRFNDTTNQLKWMQFICRINCTNKKVGNLSPPSIQLLKLI